MAIVDLGGGITLGDGFGVVRETVKGLLKESPKNLLMNLGDVSYIDSAPVSSPGWRPFSSHA